jgi:hypothetical protein
MEVERTTALVRHVHRLPAFNWVGRRTLSELANGGQFSEGDSYPPITLPDRNPAAIHRPSRPRSHRLLQHVLPERLHHVRGYGLLAPTQRDALERAHRLLGQPDRAAVSAEAEPAERKDDEGNSHRCPFCREGRMHVIARMSAEQLRARLVDTSPARSPP